VLTRCAALRSSKSLLLSRLALIFVKVPFADALL